MNVTSVAACIFLGILSNAIWDAMKATLLGVWNNREQFLYQEIFELKIEMPNRLHPVRQKKEEAKPK